MEERYETKENREMEKWKDRVLVIEHGKKQVESKEYESCIWKWYIIAEMGIGFFIEDIGGSALRTYVLKQRGKNSLKYRIITFIA